MTRPVPIGSTVLLLILVSLPTPAQEQQAGDAAAANPPLRLTAASIRHGRFDLISFDPNGNELAVLVTDPKAAMEPAWSPDGRSLALIAFRTGVGQVFVMDMETRSVINLTKTKTYERIPAWSPDSKQIAFTSNRSGNQDIVVMNADGGNPINLTNHEGYDADPAWSPDGMQIAFASMRDGRPFRLFVMDADGSNQRPLIDDDLAGWLLPDWSPDGKTIAVGKYEDGSVQLHLLDLESRTLRPVTSTKGLNMYPRWSPDGRLIAYAYFDAPPLAYAPGMTFDVNAAGGDLMVYEIATGQHRRVLQGELPYWGPRAAWQVSAGEGDDKD